MKEFDNGKRLHYLENAVIIPTQIDPENRTFSGCVYDQSGHLVSTSQRTKSHVAWKPTDLDQLPDDTDIREIFDGKCIYLGHYSGHYGHFLLETLSRFWVFQENLDYDRLIFQPFIHNIPHPSVFSPAKACFECFNIKLNRVVFLKKTYRCKHLTIPNSLVEINNWANPEQLVIYKQITEYCRKTSLKTRGLLNCFFNSTFYRAFKHNRFYLSRRKLRSPHYIKNEDEIEKYFANLVSMLFIPRTLTLRSRLFYTTKLQFWLVFPGQYYTIRYL